LLTFAHHLNYVQNSQPQDSASDLSALCMHGELQELLNPPFFLTGGNGACFLCPS